MKSELLQIHWQFKNNTTEMRAQKEINSYKEMKEWFNDIAGSNPLPEGAIWMFCNEKSNHFLKKPLI